MYKRILMNSLFIILILLSFFGNKPVLAEDGEVIIGEGDFFFKVTWPVEWVESGEATFPGSLTLEIPSNGGNVTGFGIVNHEFLGDSSYSYEFSFSGDFSCHDGGKIGGTVVIAYYYYDSLNPSGDFLYTVDTTWSGQLYADGTGKGIIDYALGSEWNITFAPENFCSDVVPVSPEVDFESEISREYIKTTYGIDVWDSFGEDGYDRAVWTDQELTWLNDVLKELPPELIDRMAVNRIVRNTVYLTEDGETDTSAFGVYQPCNITVDPHCDGSSATIRIFDHARSPFDFLNDPDGEKQFKATILHEMVHGMQYYKDRHSIYKNEYSPLIENYIDATRQITDMEAPGFNGWNGWNWDGRRWRYTNDSSNQPPTNYGLTDPFEDMADSVMMYVYDPERLKNSSFERYYFIRDEMFGGVEYEDGVQKKP